jgi:hypothetical protein
MHTTFSDNNFMAGAVEVVNAFTFALAKPIIAYCRISFALLDFYCAVLRYSSFRTERVHARS